MALVFQMGSIAAYSWTSGSPPCSRSRTFVGGITIGLRKAWGSLRASLYIVCDGMFIDGARCNQQPTAFRTGVSVLRTKELAMSIPGSDGTPSAPVISNSPPGDGSDAHHLKSDSNSVDPASVEEKARESGTALYDNYESIQKAVGKKPHEPLTLTDLAWIDDNRDTPITGDPRKDSNIKAAARLALMQNDIRKELDTGFGRDAFQDYIFTKENLKGAIQGPPAMSDLFLVRL